MLELLDLAKSYGSVRAVDRVSLTIREGEFFSLLGPSGCGKTTLLRMLGGFETPSSGQVRLDGARIDLLPPHQRPFNMVFQRYALFPHLNVGGNVAFGLQMKKVRHQEIRARVEEILALVKMEGYGPRAIATLSGGQQQRIALARALVNRPRVLLLDEPLSALDLKLRQQMQVELLALQKRLGHTFVFVTHDQEEALTLSDRIAVMNGGVIEQIGAPREIYERPRSEFVARFIGAMNDLGGKRMIRPEKIRLSKAGQARGGDASRSLEGTLREILYQGPVTQFLIQARGDTRELTLLVTQPNIALYEKVEYAMGDRVRMEWSIADELVLGSHD